MSANIGWSWRWIDGELQLLFHGTALGDLKPDGTGWRPSLFDELRLTWGDDLEAARMTLLAKAGGPMDLPIPVAIFNPETSTSYAEIPMAPGANKVPTTPDITLSAKTYLLSTCTAALTDDGGRLWPELGSVCAPDWRADNEFGNGLLGLLMGEGDGFLLDWSESAQWLVVEVDADTVVWLDGAVKVPRGRWSTAARATARWRSSWSSARNPTR